MRKFTLFRQADLIGISLYSLAKSAVGFTLATLASAGISCRRVSVCPSVTSRCSNETTKRRITQTTPHNSQGLEFCGAENPGKTQTGSPPTKAPNAGGRLKCRLVS